MLNEQVSLVIFTCEGREHLLQKTYNSFLTACDYKFTQVILAIDGAIDNVILSHINPDLIIYNYKRKGYVNNIKNALVSINTPYFFWLEDDWIFHEKIDVPGITSLLINNEDWVEVLLSKYGPLTDELKAFPLEGNLYRTSFGFSANPCICNSKHLKTGFKLLIKSPKGNIPGKDGFENFLSKTFEQQDLKCVIMDPVNHISISHDGYLESTSRNWHMTNSLNNNTGPHLLTIPQPSALRKLLMVPKLFKAFFDLAFGQLANNKVYELCFRIIASVNIIKKE